MRTKLADSTLEKIKYCIFQGDLTNHPTFRFWKERWPSLVVDLGSEITDQEFLSQQKVTTLELDGEIIGMHLITTYPTSRFDDPYFSDYPSVAMKQIRTLSGVQSLRYLIVDEKWSTANTLINFGAIILSLSLRHQQHESLGGSVTYARADLAAATLCTKLGFETCALGEMHNVPIKFMVCTDPIPYTKGGVADWAEYYWKNRHEEFVEQKIKKSA